jgi:hypothetical protein
VRELLVENLGFHVWQDNTRIPPRRYWSVKVPVIIAAPGLSAPPASGRVQLWTLDIGYSGNAFCYEQHLVGAGLRREKWQLTGTVTHRSVLSQEKRQGVLCQVDFWLLCSSDRNAKRPRFYRLEVAPGIGVNCERRTLGPEYDRPLIGMGLLMKARLKIDLDFEARSVSIWSPETTHVSTRGLK